jgi:excisionase family DNA binding protein
MLEGQDMEQGATITEAARILGVSENAVLQRIKRGTLPAVRDPDRKWRVLAFATDQQPTDRPANQPTDHERSLPLRTQQEGAALVIREAIAPFVERLETVNRELGSLRTELSHERERREAAERERDELRTLLTAAPAPPGDAQITPAASDDLPIAAEAQPRRSWWQRFWHGPSEMPV